MNELACTTTSLPEKFLEDSKLIGNKTEKFLEIVYPSYLLGNRKIDNLIDTNSSEQLQRMTFFRIANCTADNVEKVFENINERFEKLFTALHSINVPIAYGLISRNGITNMVLGVYSRDDVDTVTTITQGMLSGIDMEKFNSNFSMNGKQKNAHGILTGIPTLYVKEQKQQFSLASIMRSLNGQNYTVLFLAKPVPQEVIGGNINELINIKDAAFSVSKRNIAMSSGFSRNTSTTEGYSETKNNPMGQLGSMAGSLAGGKLFGPIGGAVGGALGTLLFQGKTKSKSFSKSISDSISENKSISSEVQNGFALELMNYASTAIERLKSGQNNGIWQTAIAYSADNVMARNIIQACLTAELSKPDAEKLPMLHFELSASNEVLAIPKFLGEDTEGKIPNALCSYLNSAELGLLCTVPTESVPDFELRLERKFPLIAARREADEVNIGYVVDGKVSLSNMPFGLNEKDLNKHTFVCGITGSGKTTTVKKILVEAKKPFLVIESAKKEYRNLVTKPTVYTLGKPEINAPQINPFYIMPGVSPQVHIDYLKDLFTASFSFYGPMSYILETCLHTVYKSKGWDLTLGYHPLLANIKSSTDFYNLEHTKKQYGKVAHKFLFPTMQELKDEIARYVDEELKYDGEVAGNVKTAMKVRLENLCVGAKGFTFNTTETLNFDHLLKDNVVFELEGLADDSDKAFAVGLLVIYINEYRQVKKEVDGIHKGGLQHLLVIEEAHRLLKNVDTERSTETSGNPKGKAVEHFTNMIAEMRSYGQGVIIAEQIPTKLAPDVIKNTSNKIVQRIVSSDDQQVIANTIGIAAKDAIQLGSLESGYAYCHKEGMALPTPVKISNNYIATDGEEELLDVYITDEVLYNHKENVFKDINLSVVRSQFGSNINIKRNVLALLNTLMVDSSLASVEACNLLIEMLEQEVKRQDIKLTLANQEDREVLYVDLLRDIMIQIMVTGVYATNTLLDDSFVSKIRDMLHFRDIKAVQEVQSMLPILYAKDVAKYAKHNVAALIKRDLKKNTNIKGTIREYFIDASLVIIDEVEELMKGGAMV